MALVLIFVILLPYITLWLILCFRPVSDWWLKKRFLGSIAIVSGLTIIRALLFFGLPLFMGKPAGGDRLLDLLHITSSSSAPSTPWERFQNTVLFGAVYLSNFETNSLIAICKSFGFSGGLMSTNMLPAPIVCLADFILLIPFCVAIQLFREWLNCRRKQVKLL